MRRWDLVSTSAFITHAYNIPVTARKAIVAETEAFMSWRRVQRHR
jgi:hypothetical protein